MKRSLIACVVVVAASGVCERARAQVAVLDGSNLIQTTATALSTAQMVSNTIQQSNLMRQTLDTINPTTFAGL